MGLYDAGPPYEVSCDDCGAAGPAAYQETRAVDLAETAGWQLAHVDGADEDLCPACVAKRNARTAAEVKP